MTSLIATSCRSRFTSTSDATGPRRHIYANPGTQTDPKAHVDPMHPDTTSMIGHDPSLTEIRDSGNVAPIITRKDSLESLSD